MEGASFGSMAMGGVGFLIGGFPMMGVMGWLGNILFPAPAPDPPELGDLGQNSYVRNLPVPICYGHCKVYGGVIWIGSNSVTMENEGSKKNPTYSAVYHADFAVAMSEGPVYTYGSFFINDNSLDEIDEDDNISLVTTTYLGTSSQTTDPLIEADLLGEDDPGLPFRNTAYIVCSGDIGNANSLPTYAAEVFGLGCLFGEYDANPIEILYDFITNTRYGIGIDPNYIDGHPLYSGSWKTARDYCNGVVGYEVGAPQPRFRYSNVFTTRQKGYDIIQDILTTCNGFVFVDQGLIKVKIANPSETPVFHFADLKREEYLVTTESSGTRIYLSITDVMEGFYNGDIGTVELLDESIFEFVVLDQTATYIDISDTLPGSLAIGVEVILEKQNITKETFKFSKVANKDMVNRIRVEFINRDDEWRQDVVEVDNVYDMNFSNEIKEQTVRCEGVRRKNQADRLAMMLLDYQSYVQFSCEFETDIVGFLLSMGDVVGVSHESCGFVDKPFRLIGKEEGEDHSVKLSLVEYVPFVFHDGAPPPRATPNYNLPNPYSDPEQVERFQVVEDTLDTKLIFLFKRPDNNVYWQGANVYIDPLSFVYLDARSPTPSVELLSNISASATTIAYDPDSMYLSFATSGSFWIDDEEVYYDSIDDINDQFLDCVRGYNNTTATTHLAGAYCQLRFSGQPFHYLSEDEIGLTRVFKAVSRNTVGTFADPDLSPTDTIVIQGYAFSSSAPSNVELNSQFNDYTLTSGDAVITWDAVTEGVNKGFGYIYGYGSGYGDGSLEGVFQFRIDIINTGTEALLRTEFVDNSTYTYTYTETDNISDNGTYEDDLTFNIYQINDLGLSLYYATIVTNS